MKKWLLRFQFSLRAMLWSVAAVSMILVGMRGNPFWAAAVGLLVGGAALVLNDCLSDSDAKIGASQLLIGAVVIAVCCCLMFGAAYGRLVDQRSGILDYVTFAVGLFALCYGLWVRSTSPNRLRSTAIIGYFAFVAGAFMLNHVLFDLVIRHLR